jgi:GntR family phosphonate transport system transcriptional regulator
MLKDEDERLMNYLLRIDESSARHQHATGESFNTGRTPASRHAGNDGNGHECRNPALWSEIAKVIAQEIASGRLGAGSRLPSENALAARFGVNRHTVRRAMSHLARRGVVRIEQGRGTHAIEDAIDNVLGKRTRFSGNLAAAGLDASHRLLSTRSVAADKRLAGALKLRAGARITEVCATGEAGERVLSAGMHYFPGRLRGIAKIIHDTGSITQALGKLGVVDYIRQHSVISARLPDRATATLLGQSEARPVICVEYVNVENTGTPVEFGRTFFPGDRIQLTVDHTTNE